VERVLFYTYFISQIKTQQKMQTRPELDVYIIDKSFKNSTATYKC